MYIPFTLLLSLFIKETFCKWIQVNKDEYFSVCYQINKLEDVNLSLADSEKFGTFQ